MLTLNWHIIGKYLHNNVKEKCRENYGFLVTLKENQPSSHSHYQLALANESDQLILEKNKYSFQFPPMSFLKHLARTCESWRLLFGFTPFENYREKIAGWYQVSKSSSQRLNHKTIIEKCILLQWQLSSQSYPVQRIVATLINDLNVRLVCGI